MTPPATASGVWDVILEPTCGGGCSTLDLLKRVPYEHASEPAPNVTDSVRAEMLAIARATKLQRQQHKGYQAYEPPRQVANMATLGELAGRPKQRYVPGTPVVRKLKGSRLVRPDSRDDVQVSLGVSHSAPALTTRHNPQRTDNCDALDKAVSEGAPVARATSVRIAEQDPHTTQLIEQRRHLEQRLLHVTQKLCRKYNKQLFPREFKGNSPSKTAEVADKWARCESLTEQERYDLYMEGRFTTQQQRDFYKQDLEPREPESDRHRRETAHTKYGNALVRNKHSLRANF